MKEQEQVQRQKRFEKRNQQRQKYLQELQAAKERKRIEKTKPCQYYIKHGRCDFVGFIFLNLVQSLRFQNNGV